MALADVFRARQRIAPHIRRTPLVASTWLSDLAGAAVSLKLESLQVSNSFKARGAFNAVLSRLERGGSAPPRVVTASAGNHGRALALACQRFELSLTVFTPVEISRAKAEAIVRHGAELRAEAPDYDEAERLAKAYAGETGAEFISPYNDVDVIAGAATIAVEIFEDAADTDAIVIPIGGGGLASGVAGALKHVNGRFDVTGVEVEASCAFQTSLRAGRLVRINPGPTLADGLGGNPDPETVTFGYIQRFVDRIVTVSEKDLSAAIRGLAEIEHLIAEGAGAAATAALVGGHVDLRGRRVVVILSGSNIDGRTLASLLGRPEA
jgi:threonine dehydratase